MNLFALTRQEKRKREAFKCHHRHNGITHPVCYDKANGIFERMGFVDIESSGLNAEFGIILSYCILSDEKKLFKRIIRPDELRRGVLDRGVCEDFCRDVRNFDRVIGYYSEKFDIPFLRTRCLLYNLDFPIFREIKHTDLWRIVRSKLKLHSNRLSVAAPFFSIKAKGHPLNPAIWIACLSGNRKALDFVLTHNIEDVHSTRELFHKLENHYKLTQASI